MVRQTVRICKIFLGRMRASATFAKKMGGLICCSEYRDWASDWWLPHSDQMTETEDYVALSSTEKYDADVSVANYNLCWWVANTWSEVLSDDYSELFMRDAGHGPRCPIRRPGNMAWALCHDEAPINVTYLRRASFSSRKNVEQLSHVQAILKEAHRVVHTEKCIYWYHYWAVEYSVHGFGQKSGVVDEMEAKQEKL